MGDAKNEKRTRLSAFLAQLPSGTSFKFAKAAGLFDVLEPVLVEASADGDAGAIAGVSAPAVWAAICKLWPGETAEFIQAWTEGAVGLSDGERGDCLKAFLDAVDLARLQSELVRTGVDGESARRAELALETAAAFQPLKSIVKSGGSETARQVANALKEGEHPPEAAALMLAALAPRFDVPSDTLSIASAIVKPRDAGRLDRTPFRFLIEFLGRRAVEWGRATMNPTDFERMIEVGEFRVQAIEQLEKALVGVAADGWGDRIAWAGVRCGEDFYVVCERAVEACVSALSAVDAGGKGPARVVQKGLLAARFIRKAGAFSGRFGFEHERSAAASRMSQLLGDADAIADLMARIRDPEGYARENVVRELEMRAQHLQELGCRLEGGRLARHTAIAAGRPDYCSAVFAPLEPLVFDDDTAQPPIGWLARDDLLQLWSWARDNAISSEIGENEFAYQEALRTKNTPQAHALSGAVRRDLGNQLMERLKSADGPPATLRSTVEFIAPLLASWDEIETTLREWPDRVTDLDDAKVGAVRDLHDVLNRNPSYVAASLLLLVMRRLTKPWQIFRVVQRITRQSTDLVVEGTELSLVGDALIGDAERAAAAFALDDKSRFDAERVLKSLQLFAGIATGVPEEFGIRRDGALGLKLYDLRAKGAKLLEQICKRSVKVVEAATPKEERSRQGGRPVVQIPPDEDRIAEAAAFSFFLAESKVLDQRAAFGAERVKARHVIEERLAAHAAALLEIAQSGGDEDAAKAQAHLRATARILEAFDGPAAADVLRRRAAAAA